MEDEFLMFVALLFSMLLAQALPPGPLGPDWKYTTPRDGEVVRLIRTDDSLDFVVVAKQVCDCQPADAAAQLKTVLGKLDNVKVNVDETTSCGAPAEHLVATGLALVAPRFNMDMYMFRRDDAIYALRYYFKGTSPDKDTESLLPQLCPASTSS